MVVANYAPGRTQRQNWQRGSPLRTARLLQLLILCPVAGLVFADAAASNAQLPAICRPAVMTAVRSPAIAAVARAHTGAAGVAGNFHRCVPRQASSINGKPACLGDHQRLRMHSRVSQRSGCAVGLTVPPPAGDRHTNIGRFGSPAVIKRPPEEISAGAHTAAAGPPAARARRDCHSCSGCVLPSSSRRPRTGPSAQERPFMGSSAVDSRRPQKVVHFHVCRRQPLPCTEVKSQRCVTRRPPLSWLLLVQPPSAADATHAMSRQQPRICGDAYFYRGTLVQIMRDSGISYSYRRRIRSGLLIDSCRRAEYSYTSDSDSKRITRGRGENVRASFTCVGTDCWSACRRASKADTLCSDTCNTSSRSGYNFITFTNSRADENSWGGFHRAGTVRGSARGPRYIPLVQQQGVESEGLAFFASRLHAKRPRAKAEKRAKNYQRAYEERRRREQQELHRQQQQQRELLEQQEEAERQRAEQRRLSGRQEDADERGSAAGGTATLTQLMEEARVASGEVIKHRENFIVVGSTQRRVHGRRPPNKQRYENQREFVTSVFKELPTTEEELQAEILKAERAWRGDMMLDELEAEIGGPDALAPGGVGALAR